MIGTYSTFPYNNGESSIQKRAKDSLYSQKLSEGVAASFNAMKKTKHANLDLNYVS